MKKISFFVAIAAAASLASCTAQAPKANMKNDVDSLSYMMGITNTQGLDMYMSQQLGVDTAYMADFIRGVKEGTSKTSPKDVAYMAGLQIGQQVGGRMFDMMSQRIFGNDSTQSLSKENFLAGFMAALQKKGMNVTMEEANAYVQSKAEAIKTKATEAQFAENKAAGEKFLAAGDVAAMSQFWRFLPHLKHNKKSHSQGVVACLHAPAPLKYRKSVSHLAAPAPLKRRSMAALV